METNWLWDKDVTEEQARIVLAYLNHPQFVNYTALLLSRTSSAKEVFRGLLSRENFFVSWNKVKRQMRKNSWNDPRIEYWQAIYDTLKEEMPELKELKAAQMRVPSVSAVPSEIGRKVKALREQTGWTQRKLAEKLDISQQIISRIESGNQNVSVETLENICNALGVPIEKFFLTQSDKPDKELNISPFGSNSPFGSKSPEEFSKMVYEIITREKEFDQIEFYDGTGDKQRDVMAYKNAIGKRERWLFQCKKYASISFVTFQNEIDQISQHSEQDANYRPDVIVFVTACPVSAPCKDKVKDYGKQKSFQEVIFWTDVELITKAKILGIYNDLFPITPRDLKILVQEIKEHSDSLSAETEAQAQVHVDDLLRTTQREFKKAVEGIKEHSASLFSNAGLLVEREKTKRDDINKAIDEAVEEMHRGNFSRAKESLLSLRGEVGNRPESSNELARIYNNLGVCFNRLESDDRDVIQAEKYFLLALEKNPKLLKAKTNLAAVHLNKGTKEDFRQAYLMANDLWDQSKEEPAIFEVLMWAKFHHQSVQEAISFYENSPEAQELVEKHEKLLNMVGAIYLGREDIDRANALVDRALKIAPEAPHNLLLKAKVLTSYAEKQDIVSSGPFEVIPELKSTDNVTKAVEFLKKALGEVEKKERERNQKNRFLEAEVKYDLSICFLWLRQFDEYRNTRGSIDSTRLNPIQRRRLQVHDSLFEIARRNPEIAYSLLRQSEDWPQLSYKEKARLSHIFFREGFPQQAREIYISIESQAKEKKDFVLYLDMSLNEILLDNKLLVIRYAEQARDLARGTPEEQKVLAHYNAVMLRYAWDNEADRLMSGLFEYDKKYPKQKILKSLKVSEEDGRISEELKAFLLKQKKWYDNVKQQFRDQPTPSYFLEKILHRTYAEILSFRYGDELDFSIPFTLVEKSFEENLSDSFEKADNLVLDYASLLNLSKMNLLGYLEKLGKGIYVSRKLFDKIQEELLQVEQEDLRNLWRFLKDSKTVHIAENRVSKNKYEKLLDDWLVESLFLAKEHQAVFAVDDLRLLNFFQSEEGVKVCNSFIVLKSLLKKEWIDAKIYATSIGDLAERFYTFLPFSGDDFFHIVMEDKAKIHRRSIHLVNELFLPGSVATSFTSVFVRFIDLLWKTGSLPEDKVKWISFLTERLINFIELQGGISNQHELEEMLPDFVQMWIIAIQRSSKDEILLIENKLAGKELFKLPAYDTLKDNLFRFAKAKKTSLGILELPAPAEQG